MKIIILLSFFLILICGSLSKPKQLTPTELFLEAMNNRKPLPKTLKDVCTNEEHVTHVNLKNQEFKEIDENAFLGCTELEHIEMLWNKWSHIPKNAFKNKGLHKLHTLKMSGGKIPILDLDFRDLKQLRELEFSYMKIRIINSRMFKNLPKLETLYIQSNELLDLDMEEILKFSPNLRNIYLNNNEFSCTRIREILSLVKPLKLYTTYSNMFTPRRVPTTRVEGLTCLSDYKWDSKVIKYGLDDYSEQCLRGRTDCDMKLFEEESEPDLLENTKETSLNKTIKLDEVDDKVNVLQKQINNLQSQFYEFREYQNSKLESMNSIIQITLDSLKELKNVPTERHIEVNSNSTNSDEEYEY